MATKLSKKGHRPDYFLMGLIFLLTVAGLVILASASSEISRIKFNDSYYYLKHQILYGLFMGLIGFFAAFTVHYQHYRKIAFLFLLFGLGLLALVFTPFGITAGGASRWLKFGPVVFQPAEIVKLSFILYLSAWLSNPKMNRSEDFFTGFLPFLAVSGFIGALLLLQPATSTVVILLGAGGIMYFSSGAQIKHIFGAGLFIIAALGLIILVTPYRLKRITTFFNPSADISNAGYQINQSLNAIGSGGLWGIGYGRSTSKISYLPAPIGDSIFAVAAEELGFVGAGALITIFGVLVFRLFWIAKGLRDKFGQLILVGFASLIALQSLMNMGALSGFMPLTGVPLPFISYGGTALAVFLTLSGMAVNISKYT
ncbi:MAG: cell division protein FtsW [Candidatus Liptonbacteria bacterium]|nr:cell division protein FtsW [Candidatus Liptonbacteria bacterium]